MLINQYAYIPQIVPIGESIATNSVEYVYTKKL